MLDLVALRARHEIRGLNWPLTGIGCERCEEVTDGAPCSVLALIDAYERRTGKLTAIANLAHLAWTDKKNVQQLFEMIEAEALAALSGPATEEAGS